MSRIELQWKYYFPWNFLLLLISSVSALHQSSSLVLDHKLWSNNDLEDVLTLRKIEGFVNNPSEVPVGFNRELIKMSMFPTAVSTAADVSRQCVEDSLFYVDHLLTKRSDWARKMMESTGQLPSNVFESGYYHAEGLFDECQTIRSVPHRFKGQYCKVFFNLEPITKLDQIINEEIENPSVLFLLRQLYGSSVNTSTRIKPKFSKPEVKSLLNNYPSLDICLPSTCSATDLGQSLAHMIGSYVIGNQSIVTIADKTLCFTDDYTSPPLNGPAILVISVIILIGLLILLATCHEAWRKYYGIGFNIKKDSGVVSVLHCFSAIDNGRKLLSLSATSGGVDNLSCLNGMRFFSACWIIGLHSFIKISGIGRNFLLNPNFTEQILKDWNSLFSTDFSIVVDTFFLMSGLLISYNLLRDLDKTNGKLNLGQLYIQRYIRLTSLYALIIAMIATLVVYSAVPSPNMFMVVLGSEKCRIHWWKHLLYINNLYDLDMNDICFSDSWYLAADMQLFLIAPFLVYLLWRWKKTGLVTISLLILGSLVINFAILAIYNLPPTTAGVFFIKNSEKNETIDYFNLIYHKPWTRAPPYMIGILTGLLLHHTKNLQLHIPLGRLISIWILSISSIFFVFFGLNLNVYFKEMFPTIDWLVKLIYGSLHRTIWAIAVAWIIVACTHGYGGVVNRFLSWQWFLPLSRLTYCVYLLQFNFIHGYYASNRKAILFTISSQIITICGFVVAIFIMAFFFTIFIEIPSTNVAKLMFTLKSKSIRKLCTICRTTMDLVTTRVFKNDTANNKENSNIQITMYKERAEK